MLRRYSLVLALILATTLGISCAPDADVPQDLVGEWILVAVAERSGEPEEASDPARDMVLTLNEDGSGVYLEEEIEWHRGDFSQIVLTLGPNGDVPTTFKMPYTIEEDRLTLEWGEGGGIAVFKRQ